VSGFVIKARVLRFSKGLPMIQTAPNIAHWPIMKAADIGLVCQFDASNLVVIEAQGDAASAPMLVRTKACVAI
jgi:hypothetical protein